MTRKKSIITIIIILSAALFIISGTTGKMYSTSKLFYKKIELFSAILKKIENDYVEKKDPVNLVDSAIKGMVSDLDPHTTYMTAEEYKKWNQSFSGYSGIGITFDIVQNKITVMSVIKGGPSAKAGLLPGDRIVKINSCPATGLKRDEVPLKLMGPKGTKVKVSVERHGYNKLLDFTLIRNEVHLESIPYAFMIKPSIGYIAIIRFSATTGSELKKHLAQLINDGMKYLIIDLRDNGGGYLGAAFDVSETFLKRGKLVVYTKGRIKRSFREFKASYHRPFDNLPVTIMINHRSASASEIVAGAMQDWDRAVIIGETSFGKGLVQSQYTFRDGSALLMTTARYYTPSGRLIQRPYENKSKLEYFTEAAPKKPDAKTTNRPVFRTKILGRTVYGGGGITPDYFLTESQDTVSAVVRKLVLSKDRLLFTFTEKYVNTHPQKKLSFYSFLHNYNPSPSVLREFFSYLQVKGFKITKTQFNTNKKDISFFLKQNIAEKLWGDEARYKVQLLRDKWFQQSLKYIDKSKEMLARSSSIKKAG
ncbi:S41 family peptidase [bacterium]|nr:S41 family peptidase [bacterium]